MLFKDIEEIELIPPLVNGNLDVGLRECRQEKKVVGKLGLCI